jgi:hypothetical protein
VQGNRERYRWVLRAQSILQSLRVFGPSQLSISLLG